MTSTWPFWSQSRYFNGKTIFSLRMVSGEKRDAVRVVLVHVLQQISGSPSPVPGLFTVPHPVFGMDEKRASCASRLAADLPPEAHLYEAVLVFVNETSVCWRNPQRCILKKGGSSLSLSVHILGWPLMCSVEHDISQSRMEPSYWHWCQKGGKLAMERLGNWGGAVGTFGV